MSKNYDVVIVGAGIIGACIGLELAKKGYKTVNIDKLPAAGYGSTGNSCAIIRTHYSTHEGCAMAYEGFFYWRDWPGYIGVEDESGLAEFLQTGAMVFKTELNNHLRTVTDHMDAIGIPWEALDPAGIKARMPVYDLHKYGPVRRPDDPGFGEPSEDLVAGAVFFPYAGYISDPQLATHNVQRAAEAAGAQFLFNRKIVEIPQDSGRVQGVVLEDGETIEAPIVVNVAGPHSYLINRMAGVEAGMTIKTRALRQEVAHVPSPEGFDFEAGGLVVSDSDIGCYSRPEVGNHILIGSEDPACDEREWVDPDDYNRELTDQWKAQVYRTAQRIPDLGIPNPMKGVVDLYDVSDDWIPIYDKSDLDGFYMAIGTSGNQFKNAPVAGQIMAELIEHCQAGHDHDTEPLEVVLRRTERTLNTGFFSRRREINQDSSFSVLG